MGRKPLPKSINKLITSAAHYKRHKIMKALIIDAIREKYSASEVKTMTIAELIEELQYYDEDTKVILSFDNGYTFGGIRRLSMEDAEIEE